MKDAEYPLNRLFSGQDSEYQAKEDAPCWPDSNGDSHLFAFLPGPGAAVFSVLYRPYGISRTPFNLTHVQLLGTCSEEQAKYLRPNFR